MKLLPDRGRERGQRRAKKRKSGRETEREKERGRVKEVRYEERKSSRVLAERRGGRFRR